MSIKRKAAEKEILDALSLLDPTGENTKLMTASFAKMSDKQFDAYIDAIDNNRDYVSIVVPNMRKNRSISTDNTKAVAKKLGIELEHQLWMVDPKTKLKYLTPIKYLVLHLPVRRQIQTLESKLAVAENNRKIDDMTDQVTRESGKSSISFPELLVLVAGGQYRACEELLKVRGGDLTALNASNTSIYSSGGFSLDSVATLGSRAKATETLSIILTAMHFDNNF